MRFDDEHRAVDVATVGSEGFPGAPVHALGAGTRDRVGRTEFLLSERSSARCSPGAAPRVRRRRDLQSVGLIQSMRGQLTVVEWTD